LLKGFFKLHNRHYNIGKAFLLSSNLPLEVYWKLIASTNCCWARRDSTSVTVQNLIQVDGFLQTSYFGNIWDNEWSGSSGICRVLGGWGPMKHFNKLYVWAALGIMVVLPLLYMDYGPKEYPELNRAINVVRYMSADRQLKRTAFRLAYPEGTPEQFVKWMFSPMGSAVWPPFEGGGEFSQEEQKMLKQAGTPFFPSGVSVVAGILDVDRGQQVVVRGDDARQMLVVTGYLDPKSPPVLVKEWPLHGQKR